MNGMNNYDMMIFFNNIMNMMNQNNNMNNMNMYQMMILFNQFMKDMYRMYQNQNNMMMIMNNMDMNQTMTNFNNYMNNNIMNNNMNMNNHQNQQYYNKIVNVIFMKKLSKYTIVTNYNEAIANVISKYLDLTGDNNINLYIHNGHKINESLTVGEAGLMDGAIVYVVETQELIGA